VLEKRLFMTRANLPTDIDSIHTSDEPDDLPLMDPIMWQHVGSGRNSGFHPRHISISVKESESKSDMRATLYQPVWDGFPVSVLVQFSHFHPCYIHIFPNSTAMFVT
jgi:hypothetical protein